MESNFRAPLIAGDRLQYGLSIGFDRDIWVRTLVDAQVQEGETAGDAERRITKLAEGICLRRVEALKEELARPK